MRRKQRRKTVMIVTKVLCDGMYPDGDLETLISSRVKDPNGIKIFVL